MKNYRIQQQVDNIKVFINFHETEYDLKKKNLPGSMLNFFPLPSEGESVSHRYLGKLKKKKKI